VLPNIVDKFFIYYIWCYEIDRLAWSPPDILSGSRWSA